MSEKQPLFSGSLLKKGLLAVLAAALLLALMGWIVGDSWSLQSYESDTVARSAVTGVSQDGDVIEQGMDNGCSAIRELALEIAPVGDRVSGSAALTLLQGGRTLYTGEYDLSACVSGSTLTLTLPEEAEETEGGEAVTVRLTLHDAGDGHLPSLWLGDSIDAGRFSVDAAGLDRLTVNGEAVRGRLCMVVRGQSESSIMTWYWPVCALVVLALAAMVAVTAWRKAHHQRNLALTLLELAHRYQFLMEQLVSRDFNTKYRQSILGVLWSFLNPLLTMSVQYVVFSTIFKSSIPNFPVYLITGIILFNFFSEAVSLGLDSIVANGPLITKVYMPKYIYPLSRSVSSLINLLISFVPLILLMLLTGVKITKAFLLAPLAIVFVFLFALGMAMLLSAMNVFFRDIKFLWGVVVLLWTYATPIFYPESIIPAKLLGIYHMNPMYQFIYFLRTITLEGITPAPVTYLYCLLAALIPLGIGLAVFRKTQDRFVFYL